MAIITIVYIPIFSLTGVEGKMFHPMAASRHGFTPAMVLSLTVVPAAVAVFMNGKISEKESVVGAKAKCLNRYWACTWISLRRGGFCVGAGGILFVAHLCVGSIYSVLKSDIALHMRIPGTGLEQAVE